MPEVDSFNKLLTLLKSAEDLSAKIESSWEKIEGYAAGASKGVGAFSPTVGGTGKGTGKPVMGTGQRSPKKSDQMAGPGDMPTGTRDTTRESNRDSDDKKRKLSAEDRTKRSKVFRSQVKELNIGWDEDNRTDESTLSRKGKLVRKSVLRGETTSNMFGGSTGYLAQVAGSNFAKQGGMFGANTFAAMPKETQARIQSSMYGLGDTVSLLKGMSSSASNFFSDVGDTMNRASSYYAATLYGGNQTSRNNVRDMTYGTMAKLNGITSAGSDANVAKFLAGRGMTAEKDSKSTYQETLRTVSNAARYMNISNEQAVQSVEGLTSAKGSANMLRNFGIYTANLDTGEEKTQSQIFEELAQRLTAGRGQASVKQTQQSIRRGALGVTIDSFFQGDEQGAQMFKQYMVDRAGGKKMTLDQETAIDKSLGRADNENPLNAQMTLAQKQTGAMNYAEQPYIGGIKAATAALGALTDASGGLVTALGGASALIQTLFGNKTFSGLTEGLQTTVDFAGKGLAGIGSALAGMDAINPIPALAQAGLIAGSMGVSLGVAGAATAASMGGAMAGNYMSGGDGKSFGFSSSSLANNRRMSGGGRRKATGGDSDLAGAYSAPTEDLYNNKDLQAAQQGPMFNLDYVKQFRVSTELGAVDDAHSSPHSGTDFVMSEGTELKAVADGTVITAETGHANEWPGGGLGNHVIIKHTTSDGKVYSSVYGHLSEVMVTQGQQVTKGQVVGRAGNTGRSTGTHLHFEIREGEGRGGRSIPLSEAAELLGTGSSSSSGSDPKLIKAALSVGANYQKVPGAAKNALSILQGLYSGKTDSIMSAVGKMAAGVGISNSDWAKYMQPGTDGAGVNAAIGTTTPGGLIGGKPPINNNVAITVQVPDVTSADAMKFATLVKGYLDDSSLMSNTGSV